MNHRKSRNRLAALGVAALLAIGLMVPAGPASAGGMAAITGNIRCQSVPLIFIGTTATAKGVVRFQLNHYGNKGGEWFADLGTSSTWAPWGWKWWTSKGGAFYAYGLGTSGNAKNPSRYCQGI